MDEMQLKMLFIKFINNKALWKRQIWGINKAIRKREIENGTRIKIATKFF